MPQPGDAFILKDDPLWFRDAIIYELHVRAFYDSDGNGMGDFPGLTQKLDYLQDLGVTAIWLLPFYPSPWKDDGYDISDYTAVHPAYGTLRDFRHFLREAHQRGLRVITELVLNHTSDQHPWFQRSRRAAPGSRWRDFYVWSDHPGRYADVRVIFKDFESANWSWDPLAKAYYWHRFYSHQPDLNYDNPLVQEEIFKVVDTWLKMSVDGLRLDAVPYLFEREGTSCENLAETHEFLKRLRAHVDQHYRNRMLLAEANQWPEDAAAYFGSGDECHMAYHFPLMPRLFMAIRMEDSVPIIDTFEHTPSTPENCQWALFLRNHDELTLEMVTDSERDYMYGTYARDPQARVNLGIRRRLAPLLQNNRRKIELMNMLLFSLPGTPVVYYGDEIGMGDNIYLGDRNAVRTPVQWSADRNAGFSTANPQRLFLPIIIDPEYHYESLNVEAQQNNPHSLLSWMKRLIAMRKRYKVFGRGSIEFQSTDNRKVLVFLRRYEDECIMVVANLSRFVQYVQLDLSGMKGVTPIEVFGGTRFPTIGELPYFLTLGPHASYWFLLEPRRAEVLEGRPAGYEPPELSVSVIWDEVLHNRSRETLEASLPDFLMASPWFQRKDRSIRSATFVDYVPITQNDKRAYAVLAQVNYVHGEPETYLLPLSFAVGDKAASIRENAAHSILARVHIADVDSEGVLFEAAYDKDYATMLLEAIRRGRRFRGGAGTLVASAARAFRPMLRSAKELPTPTPRKVTQRNASVVFGEEYILKSLRRVQGGANVEVEMGRYLAEQRDFAHVARVAGTVEYHRRNEEPITIALLHTYVPNEGDAWGYTLDAVGDYLDDALGQLEEIEEIAPPTDDVLELADHEVPPLVARLIGPYLESARLLGRRTAQMHVVLSRSEGDPAFDPEPFTDFHRRALFHAMDSAAKYALRALRGRLNNLPSDVQDHARYVLDRESDVRGIARALRDTKIRALRIRCHGYYHLRQVLFTGNDFVIVDFEGEPRRRLSERRLKNSPLRDVATMLRSFHYVANTCLLDRVPDIVVGHDELGWLQPAALFWQIWVSAVFLKAYLDVAQEGGLLPESREELSLLLRAFLLDRSVSELGYELENRPDWLRVPLDGIVRLLKASE
jgi:maltose alpha-D-glucosyltransferase/alpha-amylase